MGLKASSIQNLIEESSFFYEGALRVELSLTLPGQPDTTPFVPTGATMTLPAGINQIIHAIGFTYGASPAQSAQFNHVIAAILRRDENGTLQVLDQNAFGPGFGCGPVFDFNGFTISGDAIEFNYINGIQPQATGSAFLVASAIIKQLAFTPAPPPVKC